MLEELIVANLGLIPEASLSPSAGLTVITGETGAGKTVMLGALRLLTGEAAQKDLIGPHGDSAEVSALFLDDTEIVGRRIITSTRSKAYLDGGISTASALRDTFSPRISIVGQHDQHTITSSHGVRRLIDLSMTDRERSAEVAYRSSWSMYTEIRSEAEELGTDHRHLERELETLRYQIEEISDAGFEPGDEERLQIRVNRLRNSESLAEWIRITLSHLGDEAAGAHLTDAARSIESASGIDSSLDHVASRISEIIGTVADASAEIALYASDLDVDPSELQATEERVALLSSLKRKYGESLDAIVSFHENAAARESELTELLESADDIEARLAQATEDLSKHGSRLSDARRSAGARVAAAAEGHLRELGFTSPVVEIEIADAPPTSRGADVATVRFASDQSLTPRSVASVASGGELSRLVLALTLASGGADARLVAFDEIDAGVGGTTALAMGRKLAMLARDRQVICVTHLPQVAAFAARHYVVTRDGSSASISEVTDDHRSEELSRMLAGLTSSEKGKEHAEELLALARST